MNHQGGLFHSLPKDDSVQVPARYERKASGYENSANIERPHDSLVPPDLSLANGN
ncbi:MAG: hypothetical protein ABJ056_10160 [Halioglobus sp.]